MGRYRIRQPYAQVTLGKLKSIFQNLDVFTNIGLECERQDWQW